MVTIASYIARRLKELGCGHVFGVPGTSCSDFFSTVDTIDGIEAVVTTNELEAGYAADGYARFAGFGTCCVAYGVGTLSAINAVTGCLVEKVPVLMLNGGPSREELDFQERLGVLFSHSTGRPELDYRVFREISVGAHVVSHDEDIPAAIDDLLRTAFQDLGPVYLEVPNDLWLMEIAAPSGVLLRPTTPQPGPDFPTFLAAAIQKAEAAQNPAILLGVELVRNDLKNDSLAMIEEAGYPFATTVLSKSIITESHPQFRGTYDTDLVVKPVRELLESSDCLIALGCVFGVDHLTLIEKQFDKMINVAFGEGRIDGIEYEEIDVQLFLKQFRPQTKATQESTRPTQAYPDRYVLRRASWAPQALAASEPRQLTHESLFEGVDDFLRESGQTFMTVLDTCLGSFPGADLVMQGEHVYAANPVWLSIGHGTPAASGVHFATGERPLIISGDGGFQMVVQAISTMVKHQIPAIVLIIDNGAYAIEQFLIDSCFFVRDGEQLLPFVGLNSWNYETMPDLFGGGHGVKVNSGDELRAALDAALSVVDGPSIISAQVPPDDLPPENVPFAEDQCRDPLAPKSVSPRWHLSTLHRRRQR